MIWTVGAIKAPGAHSQCDFDKVQYLSTSLIKL